MIDYRKKLHLNYSLQLIVPDVVNGGDILIGQVFYTIEDGTSATTQKDVWNKDLYERFKEEIETEIYKFEKECENHAQNFKICIKPSPDSINNTRIEELEKENKTLKDKTKEVEEITNNLLVEMLEIKTEGEKENV